MSNDSKKLLTLGNVETIKDYIDTTSGNIKYYIDEEFKDTVYTKIEQAKGELNDNFIAKTTEITNKITLLEQTSGNKDEINELKLQLDAVKADNDAMNTVLESLSKELETGLNDVSGSIMSAGQINDLVSTALINSVNISDDAVEAPTVYTQNLVALIGKFGQIKATNIVGSEISGKTVKSTSGSWELNNNGVGKLANGNITWNENGDVTFGPNVKLNWSNIEGSDDATDGVEAAMDAAIAAAAAAATAQAAANEATALANEAKNSIPSEARITEITRNSITTENITGTTLSGKTIKSTDDKWELNSTGAGYLGNFDGVKAIEWNTDGVKIQGEKVEISGDVKINGSAILNGIENDAKGDFETMVTDSINVDSIAAKVIDSGKIKTDVLETKPKDTTDKIYIKENYLKVLDGKGNEMCEVSSNEIPTIDKDVIFNNGWIDIITDDMVANTANNSFNADLYINDVSGKTFSGVFSKEIYNNNLGYFSEGDTLFFDNVQGMEDIYLINTTIKGHDEHDFRIESVIISDFILTCELCNNNDDAKRIPVGLLSEIVKENYQFKTINDMQMVKSFLNMAYFDTDEHISITESGLYTLKWYFNFNYEFTVINENATYDKLNAPIFNVATEYADTLDVHLSKRPNQKTIIANNGVMILNAGGGMLINEEGIFLKNGKAGFRIYTDKSDPDNPVAKIEVCKNANDTNPTYVSLLS